ncbi:outer membrane protein assembly factor BamE [Pseudooceanicola onchidii]|uniref:outer membrane protein assembly factor BamE n=1 Tax=Pseudooceanicola onchidii TaxID=2562279 RepID=UPI001F10ABE9|nr:outer membrane protein assembly factor BamE [Pseudooceanicola onchidii]
MTVAIDAAARRMARVVRMTLLGLLVVGVAACAERTRNHGYVPDEEDLTQITVGVDTRDTVSDVLGAPSTSGIVDDSGYYYVRSTFRHFGPTEPRVVEREIVAISFDTAGVVTNVERYGLEDGRTVVLSRRVTDSQAGNNGFLRQLLRNLGQFDPASFGS